MFKRAMVLVDEAYMELADDRDGNTFIGLIKEYQDVIASRTFSKGKIIEARKMVLATLDVLDLKHLPSQTNCVYIKSGLPTNDRQAAMTKHDIYIRGQYMDYTDWSRVSMGKIEDIERFCKALPELFATWPGCRPASKRRLGLLLRSFLFGGNE
jgi:histidinol-phosphate aminotransferase